MSEHPNKNKNEESNEEKRNKCIKKKNEKRKKSDQTIKRSGNLHEKTNLKRSLLKDFRQVFMEYKFNTLMYNLLVKKTLKNK